MLYSSETKAEVRLTCIVTYGQTGKQGMDGKPLSGFGNYWKSAQQCWDLFITFSPDDFFSFQIYLSMFIYLVNFFSAFYWILRRKTDCDWHVPWSAHWMVWDLPMWPVLYPRREMTVYFLSFCASDSACRVHPHTGKHASSPARGRAGSLTGKITEQGMPRVQRRH